MMLLFFLQEVVSKRRRTPSQVVALLCLRSARRGESLCSFIQPPPPPRPGKEDHQQSSPHTHEKGTYANTMRLTPREQRGRSRKQEPCPNDAEHQCSKGGAQPQHASDREARTLPAAPIRGDAPRGLLEVRKAMDSDERKPQQRTEDMGQKERLKRAGHDESDPTANHDHGRDKQHRAEHAQHQRRWSPAHIGRGSGVVAQKAPAS